MISSKGYAVTTGYTTLLAEDGSRRDISLQNNTTGTLYLTVGGSTSDTDALVVPSGGFFSATVPFSGIIKAKSTVAGNVTVLGDNLP